MPLEILKGFCPLKVLLDVSSSVPLERSKVNSMSSSVTGSYFMAFIFNGFVCDPMGLPISEVTSEITYYCINFNKLSHVEFKAVD